jgi:hypothetical protein
MKPIFGANLAMLLFQSNKNAFVLLMQSFKDR